MESQGFNIVNSLLGITLLGSEWGVWLLLILSVLSVAVMIERMVFFVRTRIDFASFSEELTSRLAKADWEGVKSLALNSSALESQVLLRGLQYRENGVNAMDESMDSYIVAERPNLDRGLVILGTLGNNAPFIGLFGTVIGIIQAFHDLAANPAGGPSVVMAGISEALVATAVGIGVAIPAVIAFNAFQRVIKRRMANAESVKKLLTANIRV